MAHERLIQLVRRHRPRIARALVRQSRILSPRLAGVDAVAHEKNFITFLVAAEKVLESGNETGLLELMRHTAELRAAGGYTLVDFVGSSLGILPVIRRFILDNAQNLDEGLDDYEAFEAVALPILARGAEVFANLEDALDSTGPNPAVSTISGFQIENVFDDRND